MICFSKARSSSAPVEEIPSLYIMSNSASVNGADAPDVDADAGVELKRFAARRGLGIAEHDADLFADLVGKNAAGPRFRNKGGELAERRAHQAGLGADGGVANFSFKFLFRDERGDGVEHDD